MDGKQKGFTLIEILVVVSIIGVLAGLVVILIPRGRSKANEVQCQNNVRNMVGLLIAEQKLPQYGGANLILYLVADGKIKRTNTDHMQVLFCPGDMHETLDDAGGVDAYKEVNLNTHDNDRLTSYAGRDQKDAKCRATTSGDSVVLIADDSDDHHEGSAFVVGLSDGSVKVRRKVDDWGLSAETEVRVGEGSDVEELRCLRVD